MFFLILEAGGGGGGGGGDEKGGVIRKTYSSEGGQVKTIQDAQNFSHPPSLTTSHAILYAWISRSSVEIQILWDLTIISP